MTLNINNALWYVGYEIIANMNAIISNFLIKLAGGLSWQQDYIIVNDWLSGLLWRLLSHSCIARVPTAQTSPEQLCLQACLTNKLQCLSPMI